MHQEAEAVVPVPAGLELERAEPALVQTAAGQADADQLEQVIHSRGLIHGHLPLDLLPIRLQRLDVRQVLVAELRQLLLVPGEQLAAQGGLDRVGVGENEIPRPLLEAAEPVAGVGVHRDLDLGARDAGGRATRVSARPAGPGDLQLRVLGVRRGDRDHRVPEQRLGGPPESPRAVRFRVRSEVVLERTHHRAALRRRTKEPGGQPRRSDLRVYRKASRRAVVRDLLQRSAEDSSL